MTGRRWQCKTLQQFEMLGPLMDLHLCILTVLRPSNTGWRRRSVHGGAR